MEENCGGGQGLNWAVESRGERERESLTVTADSTYSYRSALKG
jgi:hypothetical protein